MTLLIKSDAAARAGVRRLSSTRAPHHAAPSPAELELASLRAQLETLSQRLQDSDAEGRRLEAAAAQAFSEGEAAGREAARLQAEERRAEALAMLEGGVAQAVSGFQADMAALERLAVLVARESAGKILGDPELHADHLARIIRAQVARLADSGVLHVAVSRDDFPHAEDIAQLSRAVGRPDIQLRACDDVKPGDCRIKLALGSMEVGVAQQWERLSELLGELAAAEARP